MEEIYLVRTRVYRGGRRYGQGRIHVLCAFENIEDAKKFAKSHAEETGVRYEWTDLNKGCDTLVEVHALPFHALQILDKLAEV